MVRRFDEDHSWPTRALQIWQILIGKAHNRQLMTYGQLANLLAQLLREWNQRGARDF